MKLIYKIVNKINNKHYIGQTTKSLEERFSQHIYDSLIKKDDKPLHRAIRKYGPENFYIELVEEVDDSTSLDEREQYWIAYYNSYGQPNGYNATIGGNLFSKDVNPMNLPEIREKVSNSQKESSYWKSDEWKEKQRIRWTGEGNPSKSEEGRRKISERVSGDGNPAKRPDVRKKISEKAKGRKPSDEARQKMSKNNARIWKGKKLPQYIIDAAAKGRSEKLSGGNNPAAKPFAMIDPNTNEIVREFGVYKEAAEYVMKNIDLLMLVPVPKKGSSAGVITSTCISTNISKAIKENLLFCNYKWVRLSRCND